MKKSHEYTFAVGYWSRGSLKHKYITVKASTLNAAILKVERRFKDIYDIACNGTTNPSGLPWD
jgi:hypothetical protein